MLKSFFSALAVAFFATSAMSATVSNLSTNPSSPASLEFGDIVTISFDYDMMGNSGRIFVRPFTAGALSPAYTASGSSVYSGIGTETNAIFTINDRGQAFTHVDLLRVSITNVDQTVQFAELFYSADLKFGTPAAVPLPASVVLLAFGLGGLGLVRSRRKT